MKFTQRFVKAYRYAGIPFPLYLLRYVLPVIAMCLAYILVIQLLIPNISNDPLLFVFLAPAIAGIVLVLLWPVILFQQRGRAIDGDMHLFVTRLGILSLSYVSRRELFNILSEMKEYREIAEEVAKVYRLTTKWHISLPRACRIVAEETPSERFADFLTRMAHAVETGESAETFAQNEQTVAMEEYASKYDASLSSIDILNEVYIAIISSLMFLFVMMFLFPLMMNVDPFFMYLGAAGLFLMVEAIFLVLLYVIIPSEHVWHTSGIKVKRDYILRDRLFWGIIFCAIILPIVLLVPFPYLKDAPMLLKLAIGFTPLLYPGLSVNVEEGIIKRRDENYSAFIRSLGTSAAGMGKETTMALEKMRWYAFGPLTRNISDLYKRLSLRIDKLKAWKRFGAETGSDLILKFNDLYVEGSRVGGNTKTISQIISANFVKILNLRKKKYQKAEATTYLYYGVTAGITVTLFVSYVIVILMVNLAQSSGIGTIGSQIPNLPFLMISPDIPGMVEIIATLVIAIHLAFSAYMTRALGSGHPWGSLTHFAGMMWLTGATATATVLAARGLLGI
jgi:flagellar protein FlaJ